MTKPRWQFGFRSLLVLSALASLLTAGAVAAQDAVTVGTVTASGTTVDVPISIRDVSGTTLGIDQPPGSKIQSFSIKVTYAPANAVSSISIARDGITDSLTPTSEFKPTTANSVSILDTFPESTNPIPFTLNAASPGNRVAHLSITLSASATPGTLISLTLDPALTQLTDAGGSAATKETQANGRLQLINGSVGIPMPALTLTPSPTSVDRGDTRTLTARLSLALTNSTTISLSSADPNTASVPSSVNIPAGQKTASVIVTGKAVGSTVITATLPPALGGTSATSNVTVTAPSQNCTTPAVPQLTAPPATVESGAAYSIGWPLSSSATEYLVDEATDPGFANAATTTVTAPPSTFSHTVITDTRYYYRVRARNHSTGCDQTSASSVSVSVLVEAPEQPVQLMRVVPVVGSTAGNFGSFFKTSVQLFNPATATVSGQIVYHPSDGAADGTLPYSLEPGASIAWDDLLPAMGRSGLGTADILGDFGSALPVSSIRVFNDAGADGTTGLNEEAFRVEDALQSGQTSAIIAPGDFTRFRLNIGIRTLSQGAAMTVTVRSREGVTLDTINRDFPATHFEQTSSANFLLGLVLTGGESITVRITSGSAFLYGATTDNTTNDPSIQFARRVD
jgi:uncharacterized protein YjdB